MATVYCTNWYGARAQKLGSRRGLIIPAKMQSASLAETYSVCCTPCFTMKHPSQPLARAFFLVIDEEHKKASVIPEAFENMSCDLFGRLFSLSFRWSGVLFVLLFLIFLFFVPLHGFVGDDLFFGVGACIYIFEVFYEFFVF